TSCIAGRGPSRSATAAWTTPPTATHTRSGGTCWTWARPLKVPSPTTLGRGFRGGEIRVRAHPIIISLISPRSGASFSTFRTRVLANLSGRQAAGPSDAGRFSRERQSLLCARLAIAIDDGLVSIESQPKFEGQGGDQGQPR